MIGLGIGINYSRVLASIDTQAQAHYDRVIADGGIIPAGLLGCNAWFVVVKAVYAVTDITTAISAGYDPHYLGAKIGAGSGTTSGQAATKLYSCSGASGDLTQATAASMPLLLVKNSTDANYYFSVDVTGNYCSTTSTYQNDDWDVEFNVKGKYSLAVGRIAGTRSTGEGTNIAVTNTAINLEYRTGGVTYIVSASTTNTNDVEYTFRVTRNSATGAVTFIKNGVTLTTSGSQIAGALFSNSYAIQVNGVLGGVQGFVGNINWVKFYISGSVVRYFNPASYNAATSQTQWTSTTGEVWTINTGTATTGYKGVLVDRTITQRDGVDDSMTSGSLTSYNNCSRYAAINPLNLTVTQVIINAGGNNHYLYKDSGLIKSFNGSILIHNSAIAYKIQLFTSIFNTTSSSVSTNNTLDNSGNLGSTSSTTIILYADANVMDRTIVYSIGVDNSTVQTAMYNAIKSFNNNAF